jgi:N6-adenosine-specific RNA methylase IME4
MTNWPFGDLMQFKYHMLMVDPPWDFVTYSDKGQKKGPRSHYDVMTPDAIKALPVGHLARDDAVLFVWATWPQLALAMECIPAWGFRYVSGGVWVKRTAHGKLGFGTGYRLRSASEPWLLATVGRPLTSRSHRNVIEGPIREYSRKPDEAYAWCESYMPGAYRADVFSRQSREGWDSWGNERTKFDTEELVG